ncbi:phage tail protein [Streptomyces sp. NPDC006290]|uniref:phage tail protein n=1 Tax=Streptomyces sp. NPDC006290 TaxID=3156745 RepID=UPI0033A9B3CA
MGNDIEIRVRVANDTAAGLASVNQAMRSLKDNARDAGRALDGLGTRAVAAAVGVRELDSRVEGLSRSLRTLRGRAAAADAALRDLRDGTNNAGNSMRTLNTRATTAHGRLGDLSDRTRTLRSDTDDLDGSMRRLTGTLGGLRGRLGTVRTSAGGGSDGAGGAMEHLASSAILLAPALLPVAASLAPIAVGAAAAGAAMGVFGAAVIGQLTAMKGATDAEKKYQDAVKQHGPASQQAAEAQGAYLATVRDLDPQTRRAAAGLSVLKDQYTQWSKSLAGDTMPVVTKGLAVFGSLMPKLTPVVKGASGEMNRFMTILAGGIQSPGFDAFIAKFAEFSTGALSKANNALVHFTRTMSGKVETKQLTEFMDYARRVGPAVGETLANLSKALIHLVAAASETGVSMLSLVNAFAKLVNAIPTSLLSTMLQVYAGFKLLRLGIAGVSAAASAGVIARLSAFSRAARFGGVGSAISGVVQRMSTLQKVGGALGVLGVVAVGIDALAKKARGAPPDVDKLTTSLKGLAATGKFSGELKKTFGDMDGFVAKLKAMKKGQSDLDKGLEWPKKIAGVGPLIDAVTPKIDDLVNGGKSIGALKDDFSSFDKSMAQFASSGHPKEMAAQFKQFEGALRKAGYSTKDIAALFPEYTNFVADARHEQDLAAQSMGLFGAQAASVQTKLDAQKQSADGLRQSIEALNDANRSALGGMIGFEASIDGAAKAAKENHGALSMVNGQLDVNSPKAQAAATALNDLAAKTKDAALASREATGSWEGANAIYERGRQQFLKTAQAMGLNSEEAKLLADRIMNIPNKTARIKMDAEDAKAGLDAFNAAVRKTPGSKKITLDALSSGAEKVLEALGLHVKRLPNGKVVITAGGNALRVISSVNGAMNAVNGKKSSTYIDTYRRTYFQTVGRPGQTVAAAHRPDLAGGGLTRGYAGGGQLQHFDDGGYISGPGTPTSDSIVATFGSGAMARVSDSEYVVKSAAVRKYGVKMLDAINSGQLKLAGFARGGKVKLSKAQAKAKAAAQAEQQARHDAMGQLSISRFGQDAGYQRSEFGSALAKPDSVGSLVNALNQWRGIIQKSTHGGTESRLLKQLDSTGKALLKQEKQLNSVNASLGKAKDKLNELKSSAASLSSSVKSGVLGSANITKGAGADKTVTVGSIMSGLTASRDKATAFAGALKDLKKKGLSKDLIQQIAEAGIEGGGLETAGALLGASSSEIKSVNSLQGQIGKAAGSAGATTADAVYGAAIKAQTAAVSKLQKSQDKLEKSMAHLAKVMEKSIEKAFGKKAAGGIVGGAASGGVRGGLTWVGEEGPELVRLPAGSTVYPAGQSRQKAAASWMSMLNEPRRNTGPAAASSSGQQAVNVVLEVRGTTNSRYEEFLLDELRRMVRARGGNVQQVINPPRGR